MNPTDISTLLPVLEPWFIALAMAMGRAAGFMLGLPQTGSILPRGIKPIVTISIAMATILAHPSGLPSMGSPLQFTVALGFEFLFGLSIGFLIQLALATVRIAGELSGVEMGLSFAAVADPLSQGQSTALSSMFSQLGVQLFLALHLDHQIMRALVVSVEHHPLGEARVSKQALYQIISLSDSIMIMAVRFALPLMAGLFALKLAMAMLARVAPSLQIFTLAFGLSITVGMLIMPAAFAGVAPSIAEHYEHFVELIFTFARSG